MKKMNIRICKKTIAQLAILIAVANPAYAGYYDWMDNIDESCNATISGRAKSIFSKYGLWFDTSVSMSMWIDYVRTEKPQTICYEERHIKNDPVRLQQCLAFTKHRLDWYARCKSVVEMMSKRSH